MRALDTANPSIPRLTGGLFILNPIDLPTGDSYEKKIWMNGAWFIGFHMDREYMNLITCRNPARYWVAFAQYVVSHGRPEEWSGHNCEGTRTSVVLAVWLPGLLLWFLPKMRRLSPAGQWEPPIFPSGASNPDTDHSSGCAPFVNLACSGGQGGRCPRSC